MSARPGTTSPAGGETPLEGGRWTAGVVRAGDTVRRPGTPFTAALLAHLAANDFDGSPRHLGWDDLGRQILSYIPGDVPPKWQRFTDGQVAEAAVLLRRFHDAGRDLAATLGGEVICHHDPGPNNTVFRAGHPVALIDFDFAAPGPALDDVAYLAWSWCISSRPDRAPASGQAGQVRVLADAYGLTPAGRGRPTRRDRRALRAQPAGVAPRPRRRRGVPGRPGLRRRGSPLDRPRSRPLRRRPKRIHRRVGLSRVIALAATPAQAQGSATARQPG